MSASRAPALGRAATLAPAVVAPRTVAEVKLIRLAGARRVGVAVGALVGVATAPHLEAAATLVVA